MDLNSPAFSSGDGSLSSDGSGRAPHGDRSQAFRPAPHRECDIRLAVTEACTNVVRHAYRDREGPLEIVIEPSAEGLTVVVADRGRGILPNPSSEGPGLGLPLIAALADALEIEHSPQRGSRLSMQFRAADHEGVKEAA